MFQISIVLKIMAVILTVPVTGTIDLTPIDNTDGEWVAPGYEVITEFEFDPLEYVDDVQAAQAFFMDTDAGEKLRIILIGDNRLLVFDEPWETYRECSIDLSERIKGITFSRNGKFITIDTYRMETYSDAYNLREWEEAFHTGTRIKITEDEFLLDQFDADPANPGFICVSNDGQVSAMSQKGIVSLYPAGDLTAFMERPNQYSDYARRAASHDNSIIVRDHVTEDDQYVIECTDWSGNVLWQAPLVERRLTSLQVSPSGEYVLAPGMNGLTCYSGIDGRILWETAEGLLCDYPVISPNGRFWLLTPDEANHCYMFCGLLDNAFCPESLDASEYISEKYNNPGSLWTNSAGYSISILHKLDNRHELRMIFSNSNHDMIWTSNIIDMRSNCRFNSQHVYDMDPIFGSFIARISENGERICYSDFQSIKVLRFEEVN